MYAPYVLEVQHKEATAQRKSTLAALSTERRDASNRHGFSSGTLRFYSRASRGTGIDQTFRISAHQEQLQPSVH